MRLVPWIMIVVAGFAGTALAAPPDARLAILEALFRNPSHAPLALTQAFAAAASEAQVRDIVGKLEQENGGFLSIAEDGGGFTIHLDKADVSAKMALDGQGRIAGLLFTGVVPTGSTIDQLVGTLKSLPGQVSLLALGGGKERAALQPDTPLAIGSAFKLVVLRGLVDAIAAHRLAWDQVVRLDPAWRSLPSGFLQSWPAGTPMTIETLADAMISVSDNTAADALIHLVGRGPLQSLSPRNTPFLTTRELFTLKSPAFAARSNAWQTLPQAARQGLIDEASRAALPDPFALQLNPGRGPEWFMTARELCTLLSGLKDVPAFRINGGGFAGPDWQTVAYKGGSEPGVLNLSVYAMGHDGRDACVSATWNNTQDVEAGTLHALISRLLHLMAAGGH